MPTTTVPWRWTQIYGPPNECPTNLGVASDKWLVARLIRMPPGRGMSSGEPDGASAASYQTGEEGMDATDGVFGTWPV